MLYDLSLKFVVIMIVRDMKSPKEFLRGYLFYRVSKEEYLRRKEGVLHFYRVSTREKSSFLKGN